jgi:hypothetical protein
VTADDGALFDVPEGWWKRRRCPVCGCALSVVHAYTYVVQRQGWVKIGATDKPRRRINELSRPAWTQHIISPEGMDWAEPLVPLLVFDGDGEHELHRRFRSLHVAGEWFTLDDSIRAWVDRQNGQPTLLGYTLADKPLRLQ